MTNHAGCKIGRVKPKLRRIGPEVDETRAKFEDMLRRVLNAQTDGYAGLAVVVWSKSGSSVAGSLVMPESTIPSILVPDFVKNRLLARTIEHWTLETIGAIG